MASKAPLADTIAALRAAIDDAVVALLATNDPTALADLVQNPAIAARLRMGLGKPTQPRRMVQARAMFLMLHRDLHERDRHKIKSIILRYVAATDAEKVLDGVMSRAMLAEAAELVKAICESPTRRAAHLNRLRDLLGEHP